MELVKSKREVGGDRKDRGEQEDYLSLCEHVP